MINITSNDISPRNISGLGWGAKTLPHVVGHIVITTNVVEILMKKRSFSLMPKCHLNNLNRKSKLVVDNNVKCI